MVSAAVGGCTDGATGYSSSSRHSVSNHYNYHHHHHHHRHHHHGAVGSIASGGRRFSVSGAAFFVGCFGLYVLVALMYSRLALRSRGSCGEDNEGSWSIGVFYGDSPFSLKPIESMNVWRDESSAWPVANPILTCDLVSDSGLQSNFVADPFLYIQGDTFYLFYETKDPISMQGDIGVAKSIDKGATWKPMGIALDEDWHLSYPYIFSYLGEIYMIPESSEISEVRLYRASNFPLQWKLEKTILKKPLVDSVIIHHNGEYWLLGSDHSSFGAEKNGQLEIWYSRTPLGPWRPHTKNPIYNTNKSLGARNGGRPFLYKRNLYRIGQDCSEMYGKRLRTFKVEVLSKDEYRETEVLFPFEKSKKGQNAWNGVRYHHLDVQQLSSGEWLGVMDGDRVSSGDLNDRFLLGSIALIAGAASIVLLGILLGAISCLVPLNWVRKRTDTLEKENISFSNIRWFCSRLNRMPSLVRVWIKPYTFMGRLVFLLILLFGVILMCTSVSYFYGGSGAEEPYPWKGHVSQFTLLTMTYDARLWNLKMHVKHYSRCSSVKEIVVVWNKGQPPKLSDLESAVPIRIRVEDRNSLNNRFKIDPLISTLAVLELDDDIMMPCDDIERGFRVWRRHPHRIVGFYPRLIDGTMKYNAEKYARSHKGYNVILTGAAFINTRAAFERYWGEEAKAGREVVDKLFNCEDVLLNFLYANASSSKTVEYVRPAWAIDTSKFSGAAISKNMQSHYRIRTNCIEKFTEMYGSLSGRKWEFGSRKDGWDL